MHAEVKRYVENNDIKGLRYIFVDCLDVDPTFEKYQEDYEYCRNISGLFESYTELTPLVTNKGQWDRQYWEKIKLDLMKNFAAKRFEHMINVAKVVYADKISRLISERQTQENQHKEKTNVEVKKTANQPKIQVETMKSNLPTPAEEDRRIKERQRELALVNQRAEEEERKQKEQIEATRAEYAKQISDKRGSESKKAMGIVLAIVVVVIVILLIKVL